MDFTSIVIGMNIGVAIMAFAGGLTFVGFLNALVASCGVWVALS